MPIPTEVASSIPVKHHKPNRNDKMRNQNKKEKEHAMQWLEGKGQKMVYKILHKNSRLSNTK
jgi:hypothetical protein